jgi:hypothetical protein
MYLYHELKNNKFLLEIILIDSHAIVFQKISFSTSQDEITNIVELH